MKNKIRYITTFIITSIITTVPAWANAIMESGIFKGIMLMISDITEVTTVVAPILTGCVLGIYFIRRGMAPPEDRSNWNKSIKDAGFWGLGATCVSGLITLGTGYVSGKYT